jgi:hypothetical protein
LLVAGLPTLFQRAATSDGLLLAFNYQGHWLRTLVGGSSSRQPVRDVFTVEFACIRSQRAAPLPSRAIRKACLNATGRTYTAIRWRGRDRAGLDPRQYAGRSRS